jgi:CBS domain-containing protein/SAM-dependent methyltransferase
MKVSDIMQKDVEFVQTDTTVLEASRLIFGRGINGVPVCKKKCVVGFVTERDILAQFYPSMDEYMEDPVHTADFEKMEKKTSEILAVKVEKIMSKDPTTILADTPLLRAQSLMFVKKVGRLPVVDNKGNLVGIISKGDIFNTIVGHNLPLGKEEDFYNWIARYYDSVMDWKKRLANEIPDLVALLKKEKAKKIIDVASSTGEHAIALAREGFEVVGIEASSLMHEKAEAKKKNLPKSISDRLHFYHGNYQRIAPQLTKDFDAALFLGNALPHVVTTDKQIISHVGKLLKPQNSFMVFQVINFGKLLDDSKTVADFFVKKSTMAYEHEQAFLSFYAKRKSKSIDFIRAIFDSDGGKWTFRGINSTPVVVIDQEELTSFLKKAGLSKLSFFGGGFFEPLFKQPFAHDHDWLTAIAKR